MVISTKFFFDKEEIFVENKFSRGRGHYMYDILHFEFIWSKKF